MSNTGRRIALLLLLIVAVLAVAPAALAIVDVVAQGDVPAIQAPEPQPNDEPVSWTYRYLVPTLLVVAVLAVVLTVVQYFVKVVGKRYRVVQ
jgi:phosphatidylglycerophosphate synthase